MVKLKSVWERLRGRTKSQIQYQVSSQIIDQDEEQVWDRVYAEASNILDEVRRQIGKGFRS